MEIFKTKNKLSLLLFISFTVFKLSGQCFLAKTTVDSDDIDLTFKHEDSIVQSKFEWTTKLLNKITRLNATVGYYNDKNEPNALALKNGLITDGQEIYIGKNLLKKVYGDENLDNYLYPTLVLGHEFGHLLQYNARWKLSGEEKYQELQADFYAGILTSMMAIHYNKNTAKQEALKKYNALIETAIDLFRELGDTNFGSKLHHGTSEERIHAFSFGFF